MPLGRASSGRLPGTVHGGPATRPLGTESGAIGDHRPSGGADGLDKRLKESYERLWPELLTEASIDPSWNSPRAWG
jgi:hypothetical protein